MKDDFGEVIELPKHYDDFWREYLESVPQQSVIGENDKRYFSRRLSSILPDVGDIVDANREKIVLSVPHDVVKVIWDVEEELVYDRVDEYGRGSGGFHHAEHNTKIGLLPEIRTVLCPESIYYFRRITPFLDNVQYSHYGDVYLRGDAQLVNVLFDLCDSLWRREKPSGVDEYGFDF